MWRAVWLVANVRALEAVEEGVEVAFRILPHESVFQTERERWLRVHHPVSTFAAQQLQCIMNKRRVTWGMIMVYMYIWILGMQVKGTTGKDVLPVASEGNA